MQLASCIACRRHSHLAMATLVAGLFAFVPVTGHAQRPGPPGAAFTRGTVPDTLAVVMIHPIVSAPFGCVEHAMHEDYPVTLGDTSGADCTVIRYDTTRTGRRPPRYHDNDGQRNEDWYGWGETLLAPFDGTIEEVLINSVTNTPGTPGRPPASAIVFLHADGTKVVYGHVKDVKVKQGESVTAGQPVAAVGNNGFGYMPHTHVGAWKGSEPLQVRIDLKAMAKLEAARRKN